ncbi:shikimate dehydrogenase [Enteractinococcus coprophilus]|uniref:Shikimate dehydrogenase n=1 Tax=Enteractinococcus coprophilus TaxID=1027633 RepID=A0A543ANW1_9MICC|nr:shikimate dehydrogenase [Enteractinococcus coprophilus]TQL74270.1 shikimate dehydrogenase [Enteractinococcus coprophilus]
MRSDNYRIGLIGEHIGTSLSPMIHTAEATAQGLDNFQYDLIDLEGQTDAAERLGEIIQEHVAAGFTGFNITHPHKQHVIAHLDSLTEAARMLGAVNNVIVTQEGWVGHNTDHSGFLGGLHTQLPEDAPRETAVLFGAGGAGAAVASALLDFGVQNLYVIDPQPVQLDQLNERLAAILAEGLRLHTGSPDMAVAWVPNADAVINATPIGMEHLPGTPFDVSLLSGDHWVADVIYRPIETQLLAHAHSLGCHTVDGTAMLVEQAADTFEYQTGLTANRQRMRTHLHQELLAVSAA